MPTQPIDNLLSSTREFLDDVAGKWDSTHPHDDLPPSFGNAKECVSLVQEILEGVEKQRQANSLDLDSIFDDIKSTKGAAQDLSAIFTAVADAPEPDKGSSYEEFLRNSGTKGIEEVLLQLLIGPQDLVDECIIRVTIKQAHRLTAATKQLRSSQASMPTHGRGAVAHHGRGDLFYSSNGGRQNNAKDHAAQYISERMYWAGQPKP